MLSMEFGKKENMKEKLTDAEVKIYKRMLNEQYDEDEERGEEPDNTQQKINEFYTKMEEKVNPKLVEIENILKNIQVIIHSEFDEDDQGVATEGVRMHLTDWADEFE